MKNELKNELKNKIKRLEEWDDAFYKYKRRLHKNKLKRKLFYTIQEKENDSIVDNDEIGLIEIIEDVKFKDLKNISRKDFESIYSFECFPHTSISYIFSKNTKRILGRIGGGYVMLGYDFGLKASFSPKITHPKVKEIVEKWLKSYPNKTLTIK